MLTVVAFFWKTKKKGGWEYNGVWTHLPVEEKLEAEMSGAAGEAVAEF